MTEAAGLLRARSPLRPTIGIVLGSGLGALANSLNCATRIPYADIPGLPVVLTQTSPSGRAIKVRCPLSTTSNA